MKRLSKILCGMLVLILLLSSCGTQTSDVPPTTEQNGATEETPATTETKELARPLFLVKADGTADCTVTKPRNASDETNAAVEKFISDFKKKTGVTLPVADEYSQIDTTYEIAVNATAGRDPVAEQMENTWYTDYQLDLWDWHVMLTARSDRALAAGFKRIIASLEKGDNGVCIREDLQARTSALLGDRETSVPLYETASGTELPMYSVRDGYEICVQNSTEAEYFAYAKKLEDNGFAKYSENTISAGTSVQGKNRTAVYRGKDVDVFLSWNPSMKTVRVVFSIPTALPELTKPTLTAADTATPTLAQIGIAGLGMSYVIQLRDYSFIILDGGTNTDDNIAKLYNYMVERTPAGKKPTIAAWVFTHADPDHIGAPTGFLQKHVENVELKSIICNFPDCSVQDTVQDESSIAAAIYKLESLVKQFYNATYYNVHTGQKLYFKGVEMEILFTEEDIYPKKVNSYNDTTTVAKFTFDNGKTFMMLGDSTEQMSLQMAETYREYTKSDILQLAHHGLIGGNKQLYQYIDPLYCFWATSQERYEGHWDTNKDGKVTSADVQHCLGQGGCDYNKWIRDASIRERFHYHASVTTVINIETSQVQQIA